ncbi:jasmonate O-methyltransferase-like [Dioscorea cayenensis subsp. rotundata]|uniref:Jasmonate O-methyltransferase-like n=1 Tax=Dioscorea cayennensis subsp. rotundata TaxID=55577 RepID=A0AB40BK39_DIOCR|nr:jasmonate O-methyltransferase-like [Dioscorea cayenensis subsp. rotundata]
MQVEQFFHMNVGNDDMSYSKNSTIQSLIQSVTKSERERAVIEAFKNTSCPKIMSIADLGCSSGPNALLVVSDAIDAVELVCKELNQKPLPEIHVMLNDLPRNDFNRLIGSFEDFKKNHTCFISVAPGSFYGRLFPSQTLHFVHSSMCLHWLSQVPAELQNGTKLGLNKGNIYISKTSPPFVLEAFTKQFERDFSQFLKCRAEEVIHGGCMVFTMVARKGEDPSVEGIYLQWELLAQALMDMASQGIVEMEKIDSFNLPYYTPTLEEVQNAIRREGSFAIKSIQMFDVGWREARDQACEHDDKVEENATTAQRMAKSMRACSESLFVSHFGAELMNELFERYSNFMEGYFSKYPDGALTNICASVQRINYVL